jgi:uncharacterized protein
MLGRMLGPNNVHEGVLSVVFRAADDAGPLLLDLKDLRALLAHVGEKRAELSQRYGLMNLASAGAIARGLLGSLLGGRR